MCAEYYLICVFKFSEECFLWTPVCSYLGVFDKTCIFPPATKRHIIKSRFLLHRHTYFSPLCSKTVFPYMNKEEITKFILISLHQIFSGIFLAVFRQPMKVSVLRESFFSVFSIWSGITVGPCVFMAQLLMETPSSSSQLFSWWLRSPDLLKIARKSWRGEREQGKGKYGNPPFASFSMHSGYNCL